MIIYLFIILCVCVYALVPDAPAYGVSAENLQYAFSYQFFHVGWRHLLINSLSLVLMFRPILKIYETKYGDTSSFFFLLVSYLGSVLAALLTAIDIPTVGASGIVFFLLGALLILNPSLRQLQNYIFVAIAIVIQIVRGNSNVALHIVAFALGCLFIIIREFCEQRKNKYNI